MKALKHRHLAPPPSCLPALLALAPALLLLLLAFTTHTAAAPPNPLTRGSGLIPTPTSTATPTATPTLTPTPTPIPRCSSAWRIVSSPNPSSAVNFLFGVAAISPDDVWAVGTYAGGTRSQTLTLHWDGIQWSHIPSPNRGSQSNYLLGVDAVSSNDVWALGYTYDTGAAWLTLIEHWDGTQWSVVPSPNVGMVQNYLYGVSVVSSNDVWAVGYYVTYVGGFGYNRTLVEHWDGVQWSVVPSPNVGAGSNQLSDVSALSASDVWAVGSVKGATLTEHWNGTQWSIVPSPNPPNAFQSWLNGVSAISPNDVWAVGVYQPPGTSSGGTVVEHWNGTQWSIVPSPNAGPDFSELDDVSALSSTDVWAIGYYCCGADGLTTLVEHWDGTQWRIVPSPNAGTPGNYDNNLRGVAATSPDDVWAVGYYISQGQGWPTLIEHYARECTTPTPTPTPTRTVTPNVTPTSIRTHSSTSTPTSATTSTPIPTPCPMPFTDVSQSDYFYEAVRYLYCRGVISGYAGNTFRPYNLTTRSQLAKIAVLAFGLPLYTPPTPTFQDVPPTHTFYPYIETAYHSNLVSGYTCTGPTSPIEPCPGLYFRPIGLVTRGQLSKIAVLAANWPLIDPSNPTFQDVPPASPFYRYIETAHTHAIISGYTCGPSPSCLEFRPANPATRGQISKIVHLAITAPSP